MTAPTDAGMPGDVGLPSEEDLLGALNAGWRDGDEFDSQAAIAAILSLIRPAFSSKEREIERWRRQSDDWQSRGWELGSALDAAEAKLAQAVEDEREACAKMADDLDANATDVGAAIRARSASRGET